MDDIMYLQVLQLTHFFYGTSSIISKLGQWFSTSVL